LLSDQNRYKDAHIKTTTNFTLYVDAWSSDKFIKSLFFPKTEASFLRIYTEIFGKFIKFKLLPNPNLNLNIEYGS